MDRSVDSIGSCSLDVDADSTDFSDTSGSLNLATPSSGKDIPREFTSRIKERCQITTQTQINFNCHQQTSAILDPNSGKISTIVSPSCVAESPICSPVKKPSYLNLACCVNGYSNLTTYDSKLRQNINKSREVSPIRPSTNNSLPQQNHRLSGNFLAVPIISYGQKSASASSSPSAKGGISMENRHIYSQVHSVDTTDNVGNDKYFKSSKFISSSNLKGDILENDTSKTTKSFIQQRVERLYGPGALAQGFYSPKKTRSQEISILSERTSNSQVKYSSTKTITSFEREFVSSTTTINGKPTVTSSSSLERTTAEQPGIENSENIQNGGAGFELPVLRHLRPEFRAQLPIMSPKRSPNKLPVNESSSCPALQNGSSRVFHINGSTNGSDLFDMNGKIEPSDKKTSGMPLTVHLISDHNKVTKSLGQTNGKVNNTLNKSSITLESNVIVPDLKTVLSCDKSPADTKIIEKHTPESSVCDKLSFERQPTMAPVEEKATMVVSTMTHEVIRPSLDTHIDQDVPDKSSGPLLSVLSDTQSEIHTLAIGTNDKAELRDGNYFLIILKTEQDRLLRLADKAEAEMEKLLASTGSSQVEVSEDILGYLRSAFGKARLLVSQKMKQFEGLCKNNLNQLPGEKFPTTNEDLQGFWDMVMLQVAHVDSLFVELDTLKKNNWQKPKQEVPTAPLGSKLTRRPIPAKTPSATNSSSTTNGTAAVKKSNVASAAAQRREAQRKQLMEIKRKNKMAMTTGEQPLPNPNQVVEIFVNEQSSS